MQEGRNPHILQHELGTGPYRRVHKNLRVMPSRIAGKCLTVVDTVIPKGGIVYYAVDEKVPRYTWEEIQMFPEDQKAVFYNFGFQAEDGFYEGPRTMEEVEEEYSYYLNHSCDPNSIIINDDIYVAARDIQVGEELTMDYSTFEEEKIYHAAGFENIRCEWGTNECRGVISPYDYKEEKFRIKYYPHFASHVLKKIEAYLKESELQKA